MSCYQVGIYSVSLIFFFGHESGPYTAVDPFGLAAISLVGKNKLLCVSTIQLITNSVSRFPDPNEILFV